MAVRRQVHTARLSRRLQARIGRFSCTAASVDGARDPVSGDWVDVAADSSPRADLGVLYLHGGGYVAGPAWTHQELLGRMARATGLRIIATEYRLAPGHPLPMALEDAALA